MKKILFILLAIAMLQNAAYAQEKKDERTVTTRIADLMAQMPAKDADLLKNNMVDIANLGEDGYVTLISGLSPAGKGNNALIEYAIGGFSAYVSQTGKEDWRKMAVNAYCKALQKLSDKQNKSFIISQFDLVGRDDAVSCLQSLLTDDDLADPAARALVKINTSASKTALLHALAQANGTAKLSIIGALGDSRFKAAAKPIEELLANSNDPKLSKTALYALAYIAAPSSDALFSAAAEKTGYQYENTNAMESYLIYAGQLLKAGNATIAEKIAKQVLLKTAADNQVKVRAAALAVLVEASPGNNQQILLQAAGDKHTVYRMAALQLAAPYITSANSTLWVKKLSAVDEDIKADIVHMLGQTTAKNTLPAILQLAKSKYRKLKLEAINAAVNLGQEQVLGDLLKLMNKGDDSDISLVSSAIHRMEGTGITAQVAAAIPAAEPKVQIALINILASRAANQQVNAVYAQLKNKDSEVQQAAYTALSQMVVKDDLPQLFSLLNESSGAKETAVQQAIIAAVSGSGDHTPQVNAVLKQMGSVPESKKLLFYKVLASLGGDEALKAVTERYYGGNSETQLAALEALSVWNDDAAAPELIEIARETKNAAFLNTAIQGYLRLAIRGAYPAEERLLLLRNAMAVAQSDEQKQQILKAAEQAKCLNTILFAGQYLNDPALQQAAANAVMIVTMAGEYSGDLVKGLLQKTIAVITGPDSGYQKEGMNRYISEMKSAEGYGREIPRAKPFVLSAAEKKEGFKVLFDGTNMHNWTGNTVDYTIEDGNIAIRPKPGKGSGGNLYTKEEFSDFVFRFEFQLTPGANNGLGIRAPLAGDAAYEGMELQILDNEAPIYKDLHVYQYHGSVYGTIPAKRGFLKPVGEWNYEEVVAIGPKIKVILNGTVILDADITDARKNGAADGKNHPGLLRETGHIGFLGHGSEVQFKNIRIKDLSKKK
ncbi:HEAT repeat [Pedobacter sp. ok626]|uniref:DUF1080 domain-containing protein n=1 Tax=Pedobacter sp. ok626 TaxID=1761882 RepID=UPI00088DB4C2|nr:DUF1080 domain-containing protein [Pedobacter sp. ok626]SDJ46665.1 HEAT repeat [Pedobacter sp. ok626]